MQSSDQDTGGQGSVDRGSEHGCQIGGQRRVCGTGDVAKNRWAETLKAEVEEGMGLGGGRW